MQTKSGEPIVRSFEPSAGLEVAGKRFPADEEIEEANGGLERPCCSDHARAPF